MEPRKTLLIALTLLFLLTGCGVKRDLIVLLPDPDGKVGAIQVTTKGGSQILDKSGYGVEVEDFNIRPITPRSTSEDEIKAVFGAALAAQPEQTTRFISFLLFFESDTTELTHKSKELLPEIVRTIRNRMAKEIYLVGHTDRVGTEQYNLRLSSRRAYYVRDLLVSSGIKSSYLDVSFRGESMPLVYT